MGEEVQEVNPPLVEVGGANKPELVPCDVEDENGLEVMLDLAE